MRRLTAALVAALLLAGCGNTWLQEYQARMAALVGTSEADLVRRLGVPTRSIEADGRRFLAYYDYWPDVAIYPGAGFLYGPYGFGGYGRMEAVDRYCETTFEVAGGKVAAFTFRGTSCGWGGRPYMTPA